MKKTRPAAIFCAIKKSKMGFGGAEDVPETTINITKNLVVNTASPTDGEFEARLAAIRNETRIKKQQKIEEELGPLNYDAPLNAGDSEDKSSLLKIGAGITAAFLALLFIIGDIAPDMRNVTKSSSRNCFQLTEKEKTSLNLQVERFESMLKLNPEDLNSLEGLAVSYAELGEFSKAAEVLTGLLKRSPDNLEASRLLAEVYYFQDRFDDSAEAYKSAIQASSEESVTLLQGLVDSLIGGGRAQAALDEAVAGRTRALTSGVGDKIPFDLLLARAFVANERPAEAEKVYSDLISSSPEDFRPYLAKGALLRSQGRKTEAEKLFLTARFLAPEDSKTIVDAVAKS